MGKPSSMIEMSMRKNDGGRRHNVQPAKPINPAIKHDPGILVLNQQCSMPSVSARAHFDLTARAEERKFKRVCHHLPPNSLLAHPWIWRGILQVARSVNRTLMPADQSWKEHIIIWQSLTLR